MKNTQETTELIIPETLNQIVSVSGLDKIRAMDHAMKFVPFMKEITELSKAYETMDKENPSPADVKTARENRLAIVKLRTGSSKEKKSLKEGIQTEGKLLDALDNKVDSSATSMEEKYEAIEKHAENLEKEQKEKLKSERFEILKELTDMASHYPLAEMQQESFDELVNGLKLAKEAKIEADKKAELERLEKEKQEAGKREEMRLENIRLKSEAEENERMAAIEKENQKKELEKVEALRKTEQEKSDKLLEAQRKQAEKIKAENEAKLKKEREENERLAKELKDKKDAEEHAIKQAKEKVQQEESKRLLDEKQAAKAPDKEKLRKFVAGIELPQQASGLSLESILIENEIIKKFKGFKGWAEKQIENM